MPRPPSPPHIRRIISIPRERDERLTRLLLDPLRGKREYGALTSLVNFLLEEWIEKQTKQPENPTQEVQT